MADVAAVTSIAKAALRLFSTLAKDEVLLLWNSEDELKRRMRTFDIICSTLRDSDRMQSPSEAVKKLLCNLRRSMYDIEDMLDKLAYDVLHQRATEKVRLFFSKPKTPYVFVKNTHKVKSLKKSLNRVIDDMKICGLVINPQVQEAQHVMRVGRVKTQSLVHEEDVIGREKEMNDIVDMLLCEDKGLSVVAIIGSGGWGKSTLAQYVYEDERVKLSFKERLWACINDLSNLEQVLIEIIASKEGRKREQGSELLREDFRRIVGGKKYILVLDDVWDVDFKNWEDLEPILRCGGSGSKVLVTTRNKNVAGCLNAPMPYCLELDVLCEESAWSLFLKKANCKAEVGENPVLEQLGKKILHKCGNVPLAISLIGRSLALREKGVKAWSKFLDKELELALSNDQDHMKNVLMFSYNDLPPNKKLCFTYCGLYPKDTIFNKDELVRLWIAQGFIKTPVNNEQSLEEEGEAYFFYLIERCFFQEVKQHERWDTRLLATERPYMGDTSCGVGEYGHTAKMHDLLHDLAISVVKEENCLLDKLSSISKSNTHSLRHISIDKQVDHSFDYWSMVSTSKSTLRTLLFIDGSTFTEKISKNSLDTLLTNLLKLRSLLLPKSTIHHVPDSIGELSHLRYLDLSGSRNLKQLPKSICELHHLMFFDLRNCTLLEKLPGKIRKLVNLRQLYIAGCDKLNSMPSGLKALTSLVKLDRIIVHHQKKGLGFLNVLDNLCGSVKIDLPRQGWPDAIEDAKKANLSRKHNIDGMVIKWTGNDDSSFGKDEARSVMEALEPVDSLEYLDIFRYMGDKLWSWIWMLKNMKELYLNGCDHIEYLVDEISSNVCFPFLKMLEIIDMKNLKGWWRQEGLVEEAERLCFPVLSRFTIRSCPVLKGRLPLMPKIEYLCLKKVGANVVEELMHMNSNCSFLSSLELSTLKGSMCLEEGLIRHLTALQSLTIERCKDPTRVSSRGLAHLTALKSLKVNSGEVQDEEEDRGMPWKALHGLEHLEVKVGNKRLIGLQYLTRLKYLEVEEFVDIEEEDGVELQLKGFHSLVELKLRFDKKTVVHFPTDSIQDLHSLKLLSISYCKTMYWSWKALLRMKIEVLFLDDVECVMDVEDCTTAEHQSLLHWIEIHGGAAEKCVDDITWNVLSSLTMLSLYGMGEREQLPDGIQHLASLECLFISGCKKMRSLLSWISRLSSLKSLSMLYCSDELERRCEKEVGEDWHLISHLDYRNIRRTG